MGILHPQQACALDGRIPGGIHPGVNMQQALRRRATAAFDHQNGFITRSATGGGDKAPGIAQVLQIEQDRAGFAVAGQEVEKLINVDIQTVTEGDKIGETHLALLGPVENGIGHRRRLRDKGQLAAGDGDRREAGVEPLPGRQQTETIWPQQAHLKTAGAGQQIGMLFWWRREDDAGLTPLLA